MYYYKASLISHFFLHYSIYTYNPICIFARKCLRNFLIQFFYMCIGTFGGMYIPPKSLGLTFFSTRFIRTFRVPLLLSTTSIHPQNQPPFRQIPNFLTTNRQITILAGSQLTMVMNPPNPTRRPQPIHHAIPAAAALLPSFVANVM